MTSIPAATVLLLRDSASGPEVLMVKRGENLAFAGGAMVFPGGRVDPADIVTARSPDLALNFDSLDDIDAAARVACAREALEETGVLLTIGEPADPIALAHARAQLAAGPDADEAATFAAMIAALGHRVDAERFIPFARWEPPAAAPIKRRFDTHFYVADAGNTASAHISPDGNEAVAIHWTTAAAALAAEAAGNTALVFPTKCNLQRLAQYDSVAAILTAAAARPAPFIQPEIVDREGVMWLTIPLGCDYPITEDRLENLRRE
ncbi:NUDIX hydrolase [Polymorphobacter glacialis]|uniref:NUDIX hydrolase n=1 Tax=Sandarakinorhabdus glacialis TaxID=1614636 RepID=A0A916ZNF4_9SPHN|nr:NUDIX domain-containing protein [Polymorphobacter glacialis]GGE05284.1 NUDIX hydrolase [Polymorphobacter glacialis]